jgi:DNA polymerase III subunit delta'
MFRSIRGQSGALQILNNAIDNDRIAQAYLFHGSDGVGKFTTALYFGMALNCLAKSEFRPCGVCSSCRRFLELDHPDLLYVFPSSNLEMTLEGEIKKPEKLREYQAYIRNKIDSPWETFVFGSTVQIRKESVSWLMKRLEITSYDSNYRICIIEDADQMNIATANAFLKTLEEPPADTVIILTTNNLSKVFPTIASRCQTVYFPPIPPATIEALLMEKFDAPLPKARIASRIADGSFKQAIHHVLSESSAMRDLAFELAQMSAEKKDIAFYNALSGALGKLKGESVIDLLRFLCLYAGDMNIVLDAPDRVVNIDKLEYLGKLRQSFADKDPADYNDSVLAFVLKLEDYIRRIRGNANLQLILINLYFAMEPVFQG